MKMGEKKKRKKKKKRRMEVVRAVVAKRVWGADCADTRSSGADVWALPVE